MAASSSHTIDLLGGPPAASSAHAAELLGDPLPSWETDLYSVPRAEPGKTVDLSGSSSSRAGPPTDSLRSVSSGQSSSSGGGGGGSSRGARPTSSRGPASIEGGGDAVELSLSSLTPSNIVQQLSTHSVSELVQGSRRHLVDLPMSMVRAYSNVAQRYLRPWGEFVRVRPAQTVDGLRRASQRGELQIHLQRNVLANVQAFSPNYIFVFMATLLTFVATSPTLLCVLGLTGGGWSYALQRDDARSRPWTLQIGGVYIPIGGNIRMAMMSLPTLLMLYVFMGPVLWSAAFYSGGISLAHAALRDRDHDDDRDMGESSVQIEELP